VLGDDHPIDGALHSLFNSVTKLERLSSALMVREATATWKKELKKKEADVHYDPEKLEKFRKHGLPFVWLKYALNSVGRKLGISKGKTVIMYGDTKKRKWSLRGVKGGEQDSTHFNNMLELAYMRRPERKKDWTIFKQRSKMWDDISALRDYDCWIVEPFARHWRRYKRSLPSDEIKRLKSLFDRQGMPLTDEQFEEYTKTPSGVRKLRIRERVALHRYYDTPEDSKVVTTISKTSIEYYFCRKRKREEDLNVEPPKRQKQFDLSEVFNTKKPVMFRGMDCGHQTVDMTAFEKRQHLTETAVLTKHPDYLKFIELVPENPYDFG